jgi:phosphoribosyl 1,2-cyclic phosphodiesterase
VLDAGTGIRRLGETLLGRSRPVAAALLFSHVHWDHIQGFPFFGPLFRPDTRLQLFGRPEGGTLEQVLTRQMTYPTFPVDLASVPASLRFGEIPDGPFRIGSFEVQAAPLHHPNGCLAYRVSALGRSVVYATDTEPHDDGRIDATLVALARGADVLIYDAQYTPEQYPDKRGWGHSTWTEAVRVAEAAGVGQLVLFHHDPTHDDEAVAAIERAAADRFRSTCAAREGLEIILSSTVDQAAA